MVSVPLLIAVVILFSSTAMAQTVSCEKGDLLFRKMDFGGLENFGHTGIYEKWNGIGDPADKSNHDVIESQLGSGPLRTTLDVFCSGGASEWLGTGSLNPTAAQRNAIISYPISKIGIGIGFTPGGFGFPEFRGYSDPERYRCDGLAERAYEEASINAPNGIVPNSIDIQVLTNPIATYPTNQASHMASYPGVGPDVDITSITCPSDPYPTDQYYKGTITITAHADDRPRGSGTKLVQFWYGVPPASWSSTPNIDKDLHAADIEDDYTCDWDTTTVADDQYTLYAKAYDQAGNSKVSSGETITVDNTPPIAAFTHSVSELTVNFDASGSTDPTSGIDRYEWDFGDGGTGSGVSPSHTYPDAGTYTVTLKVWDKAGNDGTGTAQVAHPVSPVPELSTVILFSLGLLVLAGYVALRKKDK